MKEEMKKLNAAIDAVVEAEEKLHRVLFPEEYPNPKRSTPESLDRFWESLPGWKADQLSGIHRG